jgi:hypothetical protein
MHRIWAGIDAGKRSHHCVVLDEHGNVLLSTKVTNDETALLELIGVVVAAAACGFSSFVSPPGAKSGCHSQAFSLDWHVPGERGHAISTHYR